jgi:hypothetical protein
MNIVKQSTGNVVLTDNSGNIVKVFVMVNALDVVSSNEIIVKYGMNQWTTLFADQIDNTQIEPAAAVPFSGNAYALVTLLSNSFFFELSGGGGSQNLSQVLTIGNNSGLNDIEFADNYGLTFDNNSRLREGTIDAGLGGNNGIAQICGLGYELKWEGGVLYVMGSSGNTIRWSLYNFGNLPVVTDDSSKGYQIGSLYSLDNGSTYVCSDATIGAAVWALQASSAPNLSSVLTTGNSAGISNIDLNNNDLLNTDKIDFNLATTDTAGEGQLVWFNSLGTLNLGLKGGNTISNLGQHLHARVVNKTSPLVPLTKAGYEVVIVSGAQGQRLAVKKAQANNDANSAGTLGVVCENIAVNQEGFICSVGQVTNINTTGSLQGETWNDGDSLYLSGTIAGAITNIKPIAPIHEVRIGYVEYAHAINGKIYVKIDNGYELDELHNVSINPLTLANNNVLTYESSTQLWKNKTSEGYDIIVKSANQNVVNSSTLVDDTELQFSVVAGGNYMIQMVLATAGDSTLNDYKFGYAVSAGTMTGSGNAICRNAANSAVITALNVTGASITNAIVVGQIGNLNGITTGTIDFGFYATSNGIFKFQFALNSGASGIARTCKGTILKYKRLD